MADRWIDKDTWRYRERFDIVQLDYGFMLLDDVAGARGVLDHEHTPDCSCDPYAAYAGIHSSRKRARATARRILRDDPTPRAEASL